MIEDLNEIRAKAAVLDELRRLIGESGPGTVSDAWIDKGIEVERQRLNVTPDPQLDNDYQPENASTCYLPLPCPRCRRIRLEADIRVTSDKAAVVMGVVCEKCGFDYHAGESEQWLKDHVVIEQGSVPSWFEHVYVHQLDENLYRLSADETTGADS